MSRSVVHLDLVYFTVFTVYNFTVLQFTVCCMVFSFCELVCTVYFSVSYYILVVFTMLLLGFA